jgi:glycerol-3-phosphate dehydrogenase
VTGHWRADGLERLATTEFDLLVIGAGVIGAATAWTAALQGASVAVIDRGDVAGATSSASSKLLHGGLRYLAMGDLGLVREAHHERRVNSTIVAPHLTRPQPFVVPIVRGGALPGWQARVGVLAYSALSGFRDGRSGRISPADAVALAPGLDPGRLLGAVRYHDHQTHDARLALGALRGAAAAGAVVVPRVEAIGLRTLEGRAVGVEAADVLGAALLPIRARAVVNAAGPWVDVVRRMEDPAAPASVRLAKGAHVLVRPAVPWAAAVTTPLEGGRVSFAIPWQGMLLLGTTDEPYAGDPGLVEATDADVEQIVAEARLSLDPSVADAGSVRARFAGLRVLPVADGATSTTRRETIISTGPAGMVSVAGGKLTTWRRIGLDVVGQVNARSGRPAPPRAPVPMPGAMALAAAAAAVIDAHPDLDPAVAAHLAHLYGSLALDVLAPCADRPELRERLHPDGPDILAQVAYARAEEWALTVEDVARRRTTLWHRGHAGPAEVARIAAELGRT